MIRCATREDGCTRPSKGYLYEYWADAEGEHMGKLVGRTKEVVQPPTTGMTLGEMREDQGAREHILAISSAVYDFIGYLVAHDMKDGDIQMAMNLVKGSALDQVTIAKAIANHRMGQGT